MKKLCAIFLAIGLMMVTLASPLAAAAEELAPDAAAEEAVLEDLGEIEIEDEETPLAGLPGVGRDDVARVIIVAGCCMLAVAGAILTVGMRREHARR